MDQSDDTFIIMPTLDHGMEWCENEILARHGTAKQTELVESIEGELRHAFPRKDQVQRVLKYLERLEIPEGEYLIREGDPPTNMYFIESGMVTAQLEGADGQIVRLRSMRGGTIVGEMGLYLGAPRTASVIASRPSVVYRLSAEALRTMREQAPDIAALLHEWIAKLLAERLAANNRTIEALMD